MLELKKRIETELQLGEVAEQKLIRAGKILVNEQTLAEAQVKENDFIVVMVSKSKSVAPPKPVEAAPVSQPAPVVQQPVVQPQQQPGQPAAFEQQASSNVVLV